MRCVRFVLQLVQRREPTPVFSLHIEPSVFVSFCQASVAVKLPYDKILPNPAKPGSTTMSLCFRVILTSFLVLRCLRVEQVRLLFVGGMDAAKLLFWESSRVASFSHLQ